MVFAVATITSVFLYDTHHPFPLAKLKGLHYAPINDLTWSGDGRVLAICSSDGYLSFVRFREGLLGEELEAEKVPESVKWNFPAIYGFTHQQSQLPQTTVNGNMNNNNNNSDSNNNINQTTPIINNNNSNNGNDLSHSSPVPPSPLQRTKQEQEHEQPGKEEETPTTEKNTSFSSFHPEPEQEQENQKNNNNNNNNNSDNSNNNNNKKRKRIEPQIITATAVTAAFSPSPVTPLVTGIAFLDDNATIIASPVKN
jgi:hypothetical protein